MPRQTSGQKKTVGRVMHEFKHKELESGSGRKVANRRQAIAIALSEAGESRDRSKSRNTRALQRTKRKERRGETARDMKEGRARRTATTARGRTSTRGGGGTRAELYAEARRRDVPGRSRMTKAQLQRALKR